MAKGVANSSSYTKPYMPAPQQNTRKRRRSETPPFSRKHPVESPTRHHQQRQSTKRTPSLFRSGAASSTTLSACTICLGRHPHSIRTCEATTLWDGKTPTHCHKNSAGHPVNPKGTVLCSDWQRPNSCSSTTHDSKHECSGCGKSDHGAQRCPRADKA